MRRIARRRIADLVDSREPQLLAGIVGDLRVVNGQRQGVAIFKLDDRSEAIEAVVNDELINAHRERLRETTLLVVQGKVQPDRFSGGLRLNVTQVWDLAPRCRFGRHLRVEVNGACRRWPRCCATWPRRRRPSRAICRRAWILALRARPTATAEVDLGDAAASGPTDEALARAAAAPAEGRRSWCTRTEARDRPRIV